jgi:hypothetical protein
VSVLRSSCGVDLFHFVSRLAQGVQDVQGGSSERHWDLIVPDPSNPQYIRRKEYANES